MKTYIHARLTAKDRATLDELKARTGRSESDLVRLGLRLVSEADRRRRSALDLAGRSVGKFSRGPRDLSTNPTHLEDFGR